MEWTARRLPATFVVAAMLATGVATVVLRDDDRARQRDDGGVQVVVSPDRVPDIAVRTHSPPATIAEPAGPGRDSALVAALAPRGSDDLRILADAMADRPAEGAGDRIVEERAGALLSRHLHLAQGGRRLRVACTALTCEATGTLTGAGEPLDATPLLEAMVAAGFSPGPFARADGKEGTDFLLYLNRDG